MGRSEEKAVLGASRATDRGQEFEHGERRARRCGRGHKVVEEEGHQAQRLLVLLHLLWDPAQLGLCLGQA